MDKSNVASPSYSTEEISKTALYLRKAIQEQERKASWPPQPWELTENSVTIPDDLKEFLFTLLTGSTEFSGLQSCSPKVQRLITSFGQDFVFGASGGRQKPPKHVLLPFAVKSLFNNVHWQQPHATNFPSPTTSDIRPFISTTLAWDNIDRLEETLSGEGTSHRVNGIAVQAYHFGPHPPSASTPNIM